MCKVVVLVFCFVSFCLSYCAMFIIFFCFCLSLSVCFFFFFFQAEDGIRDWSVTGVQTCALPISIDFALQSGWTCKFHRPTALKREVDSFANVFVRMIVHAARKAA